MKNFLCLVFLMSMASMQAQVALQWVSTFNGTGDYNDRYTCIATGSDGAIYAAGSTVNPDVDRDFLIVKMNASGTVVWSKQYNGNGNGPDEITAIALDNQGNILVTGLSKGDNTSEDYLTLKLNPAGDTLWSRRYDFAGEYDQPNSIAVGTDGAVYVTGQSDQDPSAIINDDYATLKYASNGSLLWLKRFNGFGNALDRAVKVLVDNQGNTYVTGRSDNGSDDDYVTIKYNSGGVQQWAKFDDRGGRDRAMAMCFGPTANEIIITGRSDNGANDDFWTIDYSTDGLLLWTNAFDFIDNDRATAIVATPTGIYVTGQSDGDASPLTNWDYLTVAYSTDGNVLWDRRYDSPDHSDDIANAIAVDGVSGAVYVTGQSATAGLDDIATIRYTTPGTPLVWTSVFNGTANTNDAGNAIAAFPNGGCAVAGYSSDLANTRNALAVQYNMTGSKLWEQSFNGTGDNNDNVRALAVDALGEVFLAGYSVGGGDNRNMALVKFDQNGNLFCQNTLTGTATGSQDDAQGLVLDVFNSPMLVGVTKNSGTTNDITFLKLDENCDSLLSKKTDGPGHGSDRVYDVTSDANGFHYLTGRVDADPGPGANDNCFTAKFDDYGTFQWTAIYNSAGINADRGTSVRVGADGATYVAGRTLNGAQYDIFLLKYDANGVQQWVKTYDGNKNDEPRELAIDASGNIILSGNTETAIDSVYDYITLKYNASGTQLWAKTFNGAGNGDDQVQAMAVDLLGNILVTGRSDGDASAAIDYNVVTLKYDPSGAPLWTNSFGDGLGDTPDDIAIGADNYVYLTAHVNPGDFVAPNFDILTTILSPAGDPVWSNQFNGSFNSDDVPNLIYLNGNDFYVAGSSIQSTQQRDMIVLKYSMINGTESAEAQDAFHVSPNPFGRSLNLQGENIPDARFEMTDLLGKIVFTQQLDGVETTLQLPDLPAGAYLYRVFTSQQLIQSGKLLKP